MDIIIVCCMLLMLSAVIVIAVNIAKGNKAQRLAAVKSFKKGKFAIIYIIAVPLFVLANTFNGLPLWQSLLSGIKLAVELVVLKYDYTVVAPLIQSNSLFAVAIAMCYVLVLVNALMLTLALIGQRLLNSWRIMIASRFSTKVYIIVGYNDNNVSVGKSITKDGGKCMMLADCNSQQCDVLTLANVAYVKYDFNANLAHRIAKLVKSIDSKDINVIINTERDDINLILCEQLCSYIKEHQLDVLSIDNTNGMDIFVFGAPKSETAFVRFEEYSNGCVHYVNKYKMVAFDFVDKHPITKYLPEQFFNYDNATVGNQPINMVMIGFGETNQEIFLTSVANNQLLTMVDGKPTAKSINYHIIDKAVSSEKNYLNYKYYRYNNNYSYLKSHAQDYLPLPDMPANEKYYYIDVEDCKFCDTLHDITSNSKDGAFTYFVIAIGSDVENIDLAERLVTLLNEMDILSQVKIFVKVRQGRLAREVIDNSNSCLFYHTFGTEDSVVYNYKSITSERYIKLARYRHLCYTLEYLTENSDTADQTQLQQQALQHAVQEWFTNWNQVQRQSNIYGCLSLRTKLNLLGYDYDSINSDSVDKSEEFVAKYSKDDPIAYKPTAVMGKYLVDYGDCRFKDNTVRNIFAIQEHQRWNAYMITNGYLPASIEQIRTASKSYLLQRRLHRNLTTFDGLKEYANMLVQLKSAQYRDVDVIKYDYQLMDDAVWLLRSNGYKIVAKK